MRGNAHVRFGRRRRATTARKRGTAARLRPYIEIVRRTQRNVKRWSSREMALRWTAADMLEAEQQFPKIIGYRDLATLIVAIEHDHDHRRAPSHNDQGGRYRPHRLTITPGPPLRKSTARETSSRPTVALRFAAWLSGFRRAHGYRNRHQQRGERFQVETSGGARGALNRKG
jgi:hypothetical protein